MVTPVRRTRLRIAGVLALTAVLAGSGVITSGSASADGAPRRIVNGWLPYWTMSSSMSSVAQNADLWGEASPFWYQATGATTITPHPGAGSTTIVETLRAGGIKVVPTVTETLNAPAMAALVGDPTQRGACPDARGPRCPQRVRRHRPGLRDDELRRHLSRPARRPHRI